MSIKPSSSKSSNASIEVLDDLIKTIQQDIQVPYQTCISQRKTEINQCENNTSRMQEDLKTARGKLETSQKNFLENLQEKHKIQNERFRIDIENKNVIKESEKLKLSVAKMEEQIQKYEKETRTILYQYEKEKSELNAMKERSKKLQEEIGNISTENAHLKSLMYLTSNKFFKLKKEAYLMTSNSRSFLGVEKSLKNLIKTYKNEDVIKMSKNTSTVELSNNVSTK